MINNTIHDLSDELILEELMKLRGQDKTDKEREFVIKVKAIYRDEVDEVAEDYLDSLSTEALEAILIEDNSNDNQDSQETGDQGPVEEA